MNNPGTGHEPDPAAVPGYGPADALDYSADGCVVNFRRHGDKLRFAVTPGPVITLDVDDVETIGRALLDAATAMRAGGLT